MIGLEWTIARLAANMNVFGFGPVRETETRFGRGTVGEFALHIQCPWRLTGPRGLITGRVDLYEWGGQDSEPDEWSHEDGLSLQTARLNVVLGPRQGTERAYYFESGLFVEGVAMEILTGDLTLKLSRGLTIEVFIDGTAGEHLAPLHPGRRQAAFGHSRRG